MKSESVRVSEKKPEAVKKDKTSQTRTSDYSQPVNSSVDRILFLQRTIGNQAVERLIKSGAFQTKLKTGQLGDEYEQEADRVTKQVMRIQMPVISPNDMKIRRKYQKCPERLPGFLKKDKEDENIETEFDGPDHASFGLNKFIHNLAVSTLIQRVCGQSAIMAIAPPGCSPGDHTFVPGTMFKFNINCDDFAPGQEAALISFASTLPTTSTFEIHSYASADAATFNEQLSCARSLKTKSVLITPPPAGAGIAATRITTIVDHGPTTGPANERRSVVIRTSTPAPTPAPTPTPTPAPAFRCGPDVSSQIRAAIAKVNSTWAGWSSSEKDKQCDALDSSSLGTVAWDIEDLHNQAWILRYQPACATAGATPPCHNSVEVDNNCHYAGSANYVIFGTMCRLCDGHLGWKWHTPLLRWFRGFPEWYMQYLINLYKGKLPFRPAAANYVPSLLWATVGFGGWPSGGTPPPGDRPACAIHCPTPYGGPPFTIHWWPHAPF